MIRITHTDLWKLTNEINHISKGFYTDRTLPIRAVTLPVRSEADPVSLRFTPDMTAERKAWTPLRPARPIRMGMRSLNVCCQKYTKGDQMYWFIVTNFQDATMLYMVVWCSATVKWSNCGAVFTWYCSLLGEGIGILFLGSLLFSPLSDFYSFYCLLSGCYAGIESSFW